MGWGGGGEGARDESRVTIWRGNALHWEVHSVGSGEDRRGGGESRGW